MDALDHADRLKKYGRRALEDRELDWESVEAVRYLLALSRSELAEILGLTYTRIYQIEKGDGLSGAPATAVGMLCLKPELVREFFDGKTSEIVDAHDLEFDPYKPRRQSNQ